jgi:serine/threonine-protein kinase HipA
VSEIEVWLDEPRLAERMPIGRLFRARARNSETVRFEYTEAWLRHPRGFEIDPEARLSAGPQYASAGADQLLGVLQDASPDRWGKLLMDRREAIEAREQRRRPRALRAWTTCWASMTARAWGHCASETRALTPSSRIIRSAPRR